jgi:hypothetical protein
MRERVDPDHTRSSVFEPYQKKDITDGTVGLTVCAMWKRNSVATDSWYSIVLLYNEQTRHCRLALKDLCIQSSAIKGI